MTRDTTPPPRGARIRSALGWRKPLPVAVAFMLLAALGAGIHRKSAQAIAPPVYDAFSYYAKAAAVWRAISAGRLVNPLNVEPVVRPPGVILVSAPFGFSRDFRPFLFRAIFVPILLCVVAGWVIARERVPKEPWLALAGSVVLGALPMFYHFERNDILPVPASWGLVDGLLAGVAALATSLLIVGARRRSLAVTGLGAVATAFTLLIKPSSLVIVPAILFLWLVEILVLSHPVLGRWRTEAAPRSHVAWSVAIIAVAIGTTLFACLRSRYLSRDTIQFFTHSQRLLAEMYREIPIRDLIVPQLHAWIGWHWATLAGLALSAWIVDLAVRARRRSLNGDDLRVTAAIGVLVAGTLWWIVLAGPSEMRYLLPFILVFAVAALPIAVSRARALGPRIGRAGLVVLSCPGLLLLALLWSDHPSPALQRTLGVGLATGQFRDEVEIGNRLADAATRLGRDVFVYSVGTDDAHGMVEAVGDYRRLIEPGAPGPRTYGPIDWKRRPLIRIRELLTSDYVVFRPLPEPLLAPLRTARSIEGFEAETHAIRGWLTTASHADGFETAYDGPLRLLKLADPAAADRSFTSFRARYRWRDLFALENGASLSATAAEVRSFPPLSDAVEGVTFDDALRLAGARVARSNGELELQLIWQALNDSAARWWISVHLLGEDRHVVSQADYPLRELPQGGLWRHSLVWPAGDLRGATSVGIGVYDHSGRVLKAGEGRRDWNGTRVLIPLRDGGPVRSLE